MTFKVTNDWSSGDTLAADDLDQNFTDIETVLNGGIKTDHLSSTAAIKATQIADRYHIVKTVIPLVPYSAIPQPGGAAATDNLAAQQAVFTSTTEFFAPDSGLEKTLYKHEIITNSGHEGFLYAIHVYVIDVTISGSTWPELSFYLNGSLIGQTIALNADAAHFKLHANSPFTNPLTSLTNGDVIEIKLGSGSSGTEALRGVTATLYEKWPIAS